MQSSSTPSLSAAFSSDSCPLTHVYASKSPLLMASISCSVILMISCLRAAQRTEERRQTAGEQSGARLKLRQQLTTRRGGSLFCFDLAARHKAASSPQLDLQGCLSLGFLGTTPKLTQRDTLTPRHPPKPPPHTPRTSFDKGYLEIIFCHPHPPLMLNSIQQQKL